LGWENLCGERDGLHTLAAFQVSRKHAEDSTDRATVEHVHEDVVAHDVFPVAQPIPTLLVRQDVDEGLDEAGKNTDTREGAHYQDRDGHGLPPRQTKSEPGDDADAPADDCADRREGEYGASEDRALGLFRHFDDAVYSRRPHLFEQDRADLQVRGCDVPQHEPDGSENVAENHSQNQNSHRSSLCFCPGGQNLNHNFLRSKFCPLFPFFNEHVRAEFLATK